MPTRRRPPSDYAPELRSKDYNITHAWEVVYQVTRNPVEGAEAEAVKNYAVDCTALADQLRLSHVINRSKTEPTIVRIVGIPNQGLRYEACCPLCWDEFVARHPYGSILIANTITIEPPPAPPSLPRMDGPPRFERDIEPAE